MIADLVAAPGALAAFFLALLIFGFAPGMVLAAVVRLIPDLERREEMQAELYEVPRWERPFWVAQQFEVALRVGLAPRIAWWWGRHIWHRARIVSGLALHNANPVTFWIPETETKNLIRPGDAVKLAWSVSRFPGERMWVCVTERTGDQLRGYLDNLPLFVHLDPGEGIAFCIDDIIDCNLVEDDKGAPDLAPGANA